MKRKLVHRYETKRRLMAAKMKMERAMRTEEVVDPRSLHSLLYIFDGSIGMDFIEGFSSLSLLACMRSCITGVNFCIDRGLGGMGQGAFGG
jgi:hypothetical protein